MPLVRRFFLARESFLYSVFKNYCFQDLVGSDREAGSVLTPPKMRVCLQEESISDRSRDEVECLVHLVPVICLPVNPTPPHLSLPL